MMKQSRAGQFMMGEPGRFARENVLAGLIDGRQMAAGRSAPRQECSASRLRIES